MIYCINRFIGSPANYWFLAKKPIGENITAWMREEPFHIIDLFLVSVILMHLIYLPFFVSSRLRAAGAPSGKLLG